MKLFAVLCLSILSLLMSACGGASDKLSVYYGLNSNHPYPLTFTKETGAPGSFVALSHFSRINEVEMLEMIFVTPRADSKSGMPKVSETGMPIAIRRSDITDVSTASIGDLSTVTFHIDNEPVGHTSLQYDLDQHLEGVTMKLSAQEREALGI